MNFLSLVRKLQQECSVSGESIATVLNQKGEPARLVGWVQDAYQEIQNEFVDWKFLRRDGKFTTNNLTNIIPAPDDLAVWDVERFYNSSNAGVEVSEYATLNHRIDTDQTGSPSRFIIKNDNTLIAEPFPDGEYTFYYDYFRKPHTLVNDNDEPLIPEQFQLAIVGRALTYYANFESAPEFKTQGIEKFGVYFTKLRANQTGIKQQLYARADAVDFQIQVVDD